MSVAFEFGGNSSWAHSAMQFTQNSVQVMNPPMYVGSANHTARNTIQLEVMSHIPQ